MSPTEDDLADLLPAFLRGDGQARTALVRRLDGWMHKRARRLAPASFVQRGLVDDVANHAWELLLRRAPDSYDPLRGSPIAYLNGIIRTSVRDIRDLERTVTGRLRDYTIAEPIIEDHRADRPGVRRVDVELDHDFTSLCDSVLTLDDLLDGQSTNLTKAVKWIALDDATTVWAAESASLSCHALKRQMTVWAEHHTLTVVG